MTKNHLFILILQASSPEDAEEGMLFMQEMIELSKTQQQEGELRWVVKRMWEIVRFHLPNFSV